jgi:hypothetical protein
MMTIEVKCGRLDFRLVKKVASYAAYDSWRLVKIEGKLIWLY